MPSREARARKLGVAVEDLVDNRKNNGNHGNHVKGRRHYRANELGVSKTREGYVKVKVGLSHPMADKNGWCYLHQLVAAAALGRLLDPGEMVHHSDEDKANNDWSNLEVTTKGEHAALHTGLRQRDEKGRFIT